MTIDPANNADGSLLPLLKRHCGQTGGLISTLRLVMAEKGYISLDWLPEIAEVFNLSQAEILGVLTFYDDFATTPPSGHRLRICEAEACQAQGARRLLEHLRSQHALEVDHTSPDGNISMARVACLGLCACGPALELNGKMYGRMSEAALDELLLGLQSTSEPC